MLWKVHKLDDSAGRQWANTIEILIKFLESRVAVFSVHTNVIKITVQKMAATSKDELLLGGGIRYLTATSQYRTHRKQVSAIA